MLGYFCDNWAWPYLAPLTFKCTSRVLYSRANPLVSHVASMKIAGTGKRFARVLHFSDPIPCPWEWKDRALWRDKLRVTSRLIAQADFLTFTTEEAVGYMEEIHRVPLSNRAGIVRNPLAGCPRSPAKRPEDLVLLYAGAFGGDRTPDPLVDGVTAYNQTHRNHARLRFVGVPEPWRSQIRERAGPNASLSFAPWTLSPELEYNAAAISDVIDAPDTDAVYLASKTADAIAYANNVLLITPGRSPARRLFAGRWRSVVCADHAPESVCRAIDQLANNDTGLLLAESESRWEYVRGFRPEIVSAELLRLFQRLI